jgi:4-aminobutyrate aminotransferase-like enzyme/Ser/Thr protein kinase RdoA (MazF antagonist)
MSDDTAFDPVLEAVPPRFSNEQALEIAATAFGVTANAARDLGSERDQAFMLLGSDGAGSAVMKVSNPGEASGTLDMEALAALHIKAVDPGLPVAVPWRAPVAGGALDPSSYRARFEHERGGNWVRMYDVIPGSTRSTGGTLRDPAVVAWGETTARLGRAMRGFFHPNARRTMLWDVQHTLRCRPMLQDIDSPALRGSVERVLDRFEEVVTPRWPSLRAQVVHGDLTLDNVLIDERGFITGIIDFGDMSHSALAIDVVAVLDSLADGRSGDELFRAARLLLDGYQRITPLESEELDILGELWAARCAVTIAISSWRAARGLEDAAFAQRYNHVAHATLQAILDLGWGEVARQLGGGTRAVADHALAGRRNEVMGPALEPLTYDSPLHVVSARGVWMTDVDGQRYLDAYNNVPCVGHSHPRVTEAIARQSRTLNTNLRYLHRSAIALAERLVATCDDGLDTVMFVNSGSEANDLAWRLATASTGNTGGLCTDFAYHGITQAAAALSPETWPDGSKPAHVETWMPPDAYRGQHLDESGFVAALDRLRASDLAPAVAILDGVLTSDGILDLEPSYVQRLVQLTHEAGGLWIADEVQGGHGRTGEAMWSYQRFGISPDFVTLGKPMGNGHPVAAVITRREIAARFARDTVLFSTFGGNQVSVAAAQAVLDVLDDEQVLPRTAAAGAALREGLRSLQSRFPLLGDVRGIGLATGVEFVTDPATRDPNPLLARRVKEGLRNRGVLVGTTARAGNCLKIRPPLAFTVEEAPVLLQSMEATLTHLAER